MATVLVSLIGTGEYKTCNYKLNGLTCETHLFPIALAQFFPNADKLLVFITEEAEKAKRAGDELTYFEQLHEFQAAIDQVLPQKIRIKSGRNQGELWEIFKTIAASLKEGDDVVFDITHAFRSLPLLSFLVIAFLRETKNVTMKAVLYGAYEAKFKDEGGAETTPVFDLSPFVELLDWLAAAKQFKKTGNASFLVELLKASDDRNLSNSFSDLSDALLLMRPLAVMEKSLRLTRLIRNEENRKRVRSKPFPELLESVEQSYSQFGLRDPKDNKDEFVAHLLSLSEWYYKNGHYAHSIGTVRETIVTVVCRQMNKDFFRYADRKEMEHYLNQKELDVETDKPEAEFRDWSDTDLPAAWKELWRNASDLRNDILHVGFNEHPRSTKTAIDQNKEFLERLKELTKGL